MQKTLVKVMHCKIVFVKNSLNLLVKSLVV